MRLAACIAMVAGCGFSSHATGGDAAIDAPAASWIEAEDYTAVTPSVLGHQWTPRTDKPMYSAASFLQLLPANGGACAVVAELATCAASLSYDVTVATAGTYFLHVRMLSTDGNEDSIWVGIDDIPDPSAIDQAQDDTWKWETRGGYPLVAGAHRLRLWQREAGIRVDVLALTETATPPP